MRFVALLRGVNVGGNKPVPKQTFHNALEDLGMSEISIYLNSGNAVFTSEMMITAQDVQSSLEEHCGFEIPTLLLPGEQVQDIAKAIPNDWSNDAPQPDKSGQKTDVLYLFEDIDSPNILDEVGYRPEIETMLYVPGAVIANISRANQLRGSLQKLIGKPLYTKMTVRNVNTARKLVELI